MTVLSLKEADGKLSEQSYCWLVQCVVVEVDSTEHFQQLLMTGDRVSGVHTANTSLTFGFARLLCYLLLLL